MKLVRTSVDNMEVTGSDLEDSHSVLVRKIRSADSVEELDSIVDAINIFMNQSHNRQYRQAAKRVRQKAYDRKRTLRLGEGELAAQPMMERSFQTSLEKLESRLVQRLENRISQSRGCIGCVREEESGPPESDLGVRQVLEVALKLVPLGLVFLPPIAALMFLLAAQMIPLYQASGFADPVISALGALGMVLGFTAIGTLTKSSLAKVFLLLAIAYESLFMLSGTKEEQQADFMKAELADPKLSYLVEVRDQVKLSLDGVTARYTNKEDKMYKNQWFYREYVEPAQVAYRKAASEHVEYKDSLVDTKPEVLGLSFNSWMKLFFRLGLVSLGVFLLHIFLRKAKKVSDRHLGLA